MHALQLGARSAAASAARQADTQTLHAQTFLRSIRDHLLDAEMQSAADVNHFSHNTV